MTDDLRAQLQASHGNAYTLERELGGGDLLLGYSSFRRMMPANVRTAAVMQRYHLDVATYVQPAASPHP